MLLESDYFSKKMKNKKLHGDFHIHSEYSYDSFSRIRDILKEAFKNRLDIIAITDHNTVRGGIEARKLNKKLRFPVVVLVGAEIKTEKGDIIGLFLNKEIKSREFDKVIKEIKAQKGIIILPHPKRGRMGIKNVDVVEGWNAGEPREHNLKTLKIKKPQIASSDAHVVREIGRAFTIITCRKTEKGIKKALTSGQTELHCGSSNPLLHRANKIKNFLRRVLVRKHQEYFSA